MRLSELFETKWWDDTPMIRLYHGTSSMLLPLIQTEGLRPPIKQTDEYAFDVLEEYIPKHQWDDELVRAVRERAGRALGGRGGDSGQVIFCMTTMEGPTGYAKSLAEHGGEIASDVYRIACYREQVKVDPNVEELSLRDYSDLPQPFAPRYAGGRPIVLELLVPKKWCLFNNDLDRMKANIATARAEERKWAMGNIEDVYDDIFDNREVRINQVVPPSMIVKVHQV